MHKPTSSACTVDTPLPLPTNSSQTSYYSPLQHSTQQLHRTYQYLHIGPVHGYTITHTCNIYKTCSLYQATKQTAQTSHALFGWTHPHATCSCTYTFAFVLRLHAPTSLIHIIETTTHLSLIELLCMLN